MPAQNLSTQSLANDEALKQRDQREFALRDSQLALAKAIGWPQDRTFKVDAHIAIPQDWPAAIERLYPMALAKTIACKMLAFD